MNDERMYNDPGPRGRRRSDTAPRILHYIICIIQKCTLYYMYIGKPHYITLHYITLHYIARAAVEAPGHVTHCVYVCVCMDGWMYGCV